MKPGSIRFDRPIDEILKSKINPYQFDVGILKDGPHRVPGKGRKSYAGLSARRTGREIDGTLSSVSASARAQLGVNYLTKPFEKKSSDAIKFLNAFFKLAFGDNKLAMKKRCENAIQAVVRNPILKGSYGRNKRITARIKGFSKKFIDTAQLFRGITARVRVTLGKKR